MRNRPTGCQILRGLLYGLIVILAVGGSPVQGQESENTATDQVVRLQDALIASAKDPTLGFPHRLARLAPLIAQTHDFEQIARLVSGRNWRRWTVAQQDRFRSAFERLIAALYAGRFTGFHNEHFEIVGEEPGARGLVHVNSILHEAPEGSLSFEFQLRRRDGQWRIVNILVDGVSDIALRRAEYTTFLEENDFDALLARLQREYEGLKRGQPETPTS